MTYQINVTWENDYCVRDAIRNEIRARWKIVIMKSLWKEEPSKYDNEDIDELADILLQIEAHRELEDWT